MSADQVIKARDPAEVREEIERAREQVAFSARALRQRMAMRTDWRAWVRRRPYLYVAGVLAMGILIGRRSKQRAVDRRHEW